MTKESASNRDEVAASKTADSPLAQSTFFAPAEREPPDVVGSQVAQIVEHPVVKTLLQAFCGQVLVLNRDRQILAASREFREALHAVGIDDFTGLRPGEALCCEHADEGPGGCGTSLACRHCGAVMAILAAQCSLGPIHDECWITMRRKQGHDSIELRAKASSLRIADLDLVVLALQDISDQKRRGVLEQSFLHDARNLLGGIITWSEIIAGGDSGEEATSSLKQLVLQMRDLLSQHNLLARAEKGELLAQKQPLDLPDLAAAMSASFAGHPRGQGRRLVVRFASDARTPVTDETIVRRILSNMLSNAFEATSEGGTVTVSYELHDGQPRFSVHNPTFIPDSVAHRIFQRSFTTKTEPGHGIGTYSMRLLAERYLDGGVTFETSPAAGTTFYLKLPSA
jgi:K+-sensing histidine kinase KdpD